MDPNYQRWHDGHARISGQETPAKWLAVRLALFGLRLEGEHVPLPTVEATLTVTGADGVMLGRLDLGAEDITRIGQMLLGSIDLEYGPWDRATIERLIREREQRGRL